MAERPKIVKLSSKSDNSATWSGEQCVAEFLDDIRSGKVVPTKLMIFWFSANPDGTLKAHHWFANISAPEEVALTALAHHLAIDSWKR